jgi:L-fuculose-phosphate aldolase
MTGKSIKEIKLDICNFSHLLYQRGLVGAAGGNVSFRTGERVFVTSGGRSLRRIKQEEIIEIDLNGITVDEKPGLKPSKEIDLHLNIYRVREDIRSVIHVHPVYATAFAVAGKRVPMVTATARLKLINIPLVGYAPPGSPELAQLVYDKLLKEKKDIKAVMLKDHGIIAFAEGMEDCFNTAELVEETARIAYISGNIEKK